MLTQTTRFFRNQEAAGSAVLRMRGVVALLNQRVCMVLLSSLLFPYTVNRVNCDNYDFTIYLLSVTIQVLKVL